MLQGENQGFMQTNYGPINAVVDRGGPKKS